MHVQEMQVFWGQVKLRPPCNEDIQFWQVLLIFDQMLLVSCIFLICSEQICLKHNSLIFISADRHGVVPELMMKLDVSDQI